MEDKLKEDLKQAQLSRDEVKVSTLRLLISEINNAHIAKGEDLSDEEILNVIRKEAKKRKEASEAFKSGGREEQAAKEQAELAILEAYLPAQISTEELTKLVEDSITELGAKTPSDMGKVIGMVLSKSGGAADGGTVSQLVKEKLING
jgi:uncharacterized protein